MSVADYNRYQHHPSPSQVTSVGMHYYQQHNPPAQLLKHLPNSIHNGSNIIISTTSMMGDGTNNNVSSSTNGQMPPYPSHHHLHQIPHLSPPLPGKGVTHIKSEIMLRSPVSTPSPGSSTQYYDYYSTPPPPMPHHHQLQPQSHNVMHSSNGGGYHQYSPDENMIQQEACGGGVAQDDASQQSGVSSTNSVITTNTVSSSNLGMLVDCGSAREVDVETGDEMLDEGLCANVENTAQAMNGNGNKKGSKGQQQGATTKKGRKRKNRENNGAQGSGEKRGRGGKMRRKNAQSFEDLQNQVDFLKKLKENMLANAYTYVHIYDCGFFFFINCWWGRG
ncbi:unnamed protein product [Orchesella dallaii]|uniref:BZIP domain-containing protein n=1 Tax=Orchesella dallaii TaxID=48710 RepID=A0ABP1S2A1_9HEXA